MDNQEEGRVRMEIGESVHMATQWKKKAQAKQKGKSKIPIQIEKNESKSFFYKKKAHTKGY